MAAIPLARPRRWLAAGALLSFACLTIVAQETPPKKEKVVPTPVGGPVGLPQAFISATGKFTGIVDKVVKAGVFADDAEKEITRKFFELHVQGLFEAEVIPAVGKLRQRVRVYLIIAGNAPNPAVHTFVRDYLFGECKKLVADEKRSMVTRVNALGIIGDLNQREVSPAPPQPVNPNAPPPLPLAAVTPYLLGVFEDTKMSSALRAVALRGLLRHAQLGLPNPADVPTVETAMLKAAQETNVPMDCSEGAHEWMRRRAVEILGAMKSPNAAQVLIDIVADANLSLSFRGEAARSLGQLALKAGDPVVGNAAAAQRLGDLAATVAETETDRRALYTHLEGVRIGLNGASRDAKTPGGLRAATPAADAKMANDLFALMEPITKQLDPNIRPAILKDADVPDAMAELATSIREMGIAAAAPPAKAKAEPGKAKEAKAAAKPADE